MAGRIDQEREAMKKRSAERGYIDQGYLVAPKSGLADFLRDPHEAKRSGRLPLAPPSRPRGFEDM